MNPEERQRAYLAALEVLSLQYGFRLIGKLSHDEVAPSVLARVDAALNLIGASFGVGIVPIEGWTPPAEPPQEPPKE